MAGSRVGSNPVGAIVQAGMCATTSAAAWAGRLRAFLPELAARPELAPLAGEWSVLLHGSTARGLDDLHSDLDLWALVESPVVRELDRRCSTRFFGFWLDGKKGHLNVEDGELMASRARSCDLPLLAELRRAVVLVDGSGLAARLVAAARRPMPADVRLAWFRQHYVELRAHHRTADNTLARGEPVATLISLTEAVAHALRAALVLDGEPYPYHKWLAADARASPTGRRLSEAVERLLAAVELGGLRGHDPAAEADVQAGLHEMRQVLMEGAAAAGLTGPWLERWWLHLDEARAGIAAARWPGA